MYKRHMKKKPKAKVRVVKEGRLGLRLSEEHKAMIERKAANRGLSASSFLLTLAIAAPEMP